MTDYFGTQNTNHILLLGTQYFQDEPNFLPTSYFRARLIPAFHDKCVYINWNYAAHCIEFNRNVLVDIKIF